jgi:ribosomal protein S18 acetylase RimI-like enzyme
MPTLEPISPHLLTEFKAIRLRALQDTPTAFGRTYAEESQFPEAEWFDRINTWQSATSTCYLAMDDGAPCAIIAGHLDKEDPRRAHVLSMWVAPTHRRTGLGATLIDAVQQWAESLQARELHLMVTNNNAPAIRFYERCGFTATGWTKPYPHDPALSVCEMIKPLTPPQENP